ncbi:hypothetical protein LTR37_004608 [Vermiconidia calcicola]|uniref:Uncharacterized protein n=1 Tax=Vermiconidia calcicola TaxID=1690605 RepID=A0ACC3NN33_9PEZI|nr:hypothetical protein LTR37_004608 [Vermiconidia calcicola]
MATKQIQTYPLTGPDSTQTVKIALDILKPHLPVSLPIYRRLQFGRFFEATVLVTNLPLRPPGRDDVVSTDQPNAHKDEPYFIAFVDRSCRPETEVWFFGSWETQAISSTHEKHIDSILTAFVHSLKSLSMPTSIHQDVLNAEIEKLKQDAQKDSAGISRSDYGGHMLDPDIMLWGAVHERTFPILEQLGYLSKKAHMAGAVPNHTFVWDVDKDLKGVQELEPLPQGLEWSELKAEHFPLVRSRTQIPRQDRTLAVLPNLGIFDTNTQQPVSWAFVGLDSSLTSLHVEPEWRGKGLAKAITTKLFREKMALFWEDEMKRLAYGYVIVGNRASEGMCRSLGGKSEWEVYWLRVDLGTVS